MAVAQSISLTQGTQSIADNTSQVIFTWTSTQDNGSWNGYTRTAYYYVSINGGPEEEHSVSYTLPKNTTTTIVNETLTIKHSDDGTCKITIRTWMDTDISAGVIELSKSLTLDTIPRASALSLSSSSVDVGSTITANISRASSSFTHTVEFYLDDAHKQVYNNVATSQSFQIPTTWYEAISSSSSCTAYCRVTTYNSSGVQIGNRIEKAFTIVVPTSVVPSIGSISLEPISITTTDGVSRFILVKGKNKIKVSVSDCTPGDGSSIRSYTFTALSGNAVIESVTTTESFMNLGPFSKTGEIQFKVTVTDQRGRSASNSQTYMCYDYEAPYITSFKAYRANSDGSANTNGTYLKCTYTPKYSSVNSTNSATITVNYNGNTSNSSLINLGENSTTYKVYLTIIDNYGGSNKTSTLTIFGQSRILNITSDGTGIAIGKMAESTNLFECRWPSKFDDNCSIGGGLKVGTSTQSSAPTNGIAIHDVRNVDITPNSFGDQNVNFYFDQISDRWHSALHMKGWSGDYAAWELAGNAHSSSDDNTLKYRQGIGDTWGDWQTVITNKNINNYVDNSDYLPLSGGTLTGGITCASDLCYTNGSSVIGNAALNCKNSDIIGVNGLYFNDATNAAGEGINFYNSSDYWDTLYTDSGNLKFHPKRSTTSPRLEGYNVYHTGNLGTIEIQTGTCTLSSSNEKTITFDTAFSSTPVVMLTALTANTGVVTGKVTSCTASNFSAIIGGSTSGEPTFMWLAVYWKGV